MKIKPIRTKADYERALREIERMWGAKEGTPQGNQLDVLATLVEAYERKHFPIDRPDPIEAIKFRLEQQGLDPRALIGVIGGRRRVPHVMPRQPAEVLICPARIGRRRRPPEPRPPACPRPLSLGH